ncbi:MAG: ABC transporter permease [Thermoproteota archaeon]
MSVGGGSKDIVDAIFRSKTGLAGILILMMILGLSIIALVYVPFDISSRWNDITFWQLNPRLAPPSWINIFLNKKLPETIIIWEEDFVKYDYYVETAGLKYVTLEAKLEYYYDDHPSEIIAILYVNNSGGALVNLKWIQPNGVEISLSRFVMDDGVTPVYLCIRKDVQEGLLNTMVKLGTVPPNTINPEVLLFSDLNQSTSFNVLKGTYRFKIDVATSSRNATVDSKLIIYGKVYGLAGTDSKRRDLFVGIVWGAPVALAFGLTTAILTSFIQTLLGTLSAWYGGFIDEIVQRVTDIYMILPFLPILITISVIYKINIWTLLGIVVALSIFGGATKTARSMTLQIMNEPYIEAAVSYGASRRRIMLLYILPRLLPYTMANIVLSVPAYVFLEAALSLLGLGDPAMPTWGKIISDAFEGGAVVHGLWWWVLIPSMLIIMTAIAFALIGLALDKVVNPRLRER